MSPFCEKVVQPFVSRKNKRSREILTDKKQSSSQNFLQLISLLIISQNLLNQSFKEQISFAFSFERRAVLDAAALQALAGESVLEKERQLSEMILQLQMVREQLLAQQEHAKVLSKECKASVTTTDALA
ncbi:hypothetical protein SFRURICE_011986 [Spodoptera frugiperda]|nr:hypothetical protein SFRURICE_011986 [Spodoptera frugiperda]